MKPDSHAFIVRIWHEATDAEGNITTWRGAIDHVGGDQRFYFYNLDGITRFIQEQSGITPKNLTLPEHFTALWYRIRTKISDGFRKSTQIFR